MAKKKVTKKSAAKVREELLAAGVDLSTLKASENGTDIYDYAQRLLSSQSISMPTTFKMKKVEDGLLGQGWTMSEVMPVLMEMKGKL